MPKQIVGSVYWIENNRQTSRVVDVSEAFSDSAQAKAQIWYAESFGDKRQLRLARFAYRQFQGKRYRVDSKAEPRRATEIDQERISKPSGKKLLKAKSTKKPVGRKVGRKVPEVASKSSSSQPSKVKPSKKPVEGNVARKNVAPKPSRDEPSIARLLKKTVGRIARKVLKVVSESPRSEPSNGKPSKKPAVKRAARKAAKVVSKPPRNEGSSAKSSQKSVRRRVARKAVSKVDSKPSRKEPLNAKSAKKAARRRVARKASKVASIDARTRSGQK